MKTTLIALAAAMLMTSGVVANERSSRYIYGDAPPPSDNAVRENSYTATDGYMSGTASVTNSEPRQRRVVTSLRAAKF